MKRAGGAPAARFLVCAEGAVLGCFLGWSFGVVCGLAVIQLSVIQLLVFQLPSRAPRSPDAVG